MAIADFDKALKSNTDAIKVLSARGLAYCRSGDKESAIQDYTKVIDLDKK